MDNRDQLLNDQEQALRLAFDGRQSLTWTAIPGIITKVDYTRVTCEVQPAIKGSIEDEFGIVTAVNLPLLVDVPIVFPSAGGFIISLPLTIGDEVLVIFSSRCIDAWWQSGGVQLPIETRMHDLSDGFAIPGPRSQPKARHLTAPISSSNAQIRNDAGTAYIEITSAGVINLVSATGVNVTGNLIVTGAVTAATIASPAVTIGGKPFGTHTHSGVTSGSANTGGPV